jgi:hypothetical protein
VAAGGGDDTLGAPFEYKCRIVFWQERANLHGVHGREGCGSLIIPALPLRDSDTETWM